MLAGLASIPAGYGLCFLFHSGVPVIIPVTLFLAGLAWMFYSRIFGVDQPPPLTDHGLQSMRFDPERKSTEALAPPFAVTEPTTRLFR